MISSRFADIAFSVVLAMLGIYVAASAFGLGYMANHAPAPGFFPLWIGLGMTVLSLWNILRTLKAPDRLPDIAGREAIYVMVASLMMVTFIGVAYVAGMLTAILILMLALGALFGPNKIGFHVRLLILSLAMTGLLHLIFQRLLGVPAL